MTKTRLRSVLVLTAAGVLAVVGSAEAASRDKGRSPSKPAKEIVQAQKFVERQARQQEAAARKAERARPAQAAQPRAAERPSPRSPQAQAATPGRRFDPSRARDAGRNPGPTVVRNSNNTITRNSNNTIIKNKTVYKNEPSKVIVRDRHAPGHGHYSKSRTNVSVGIKVSSGGHVGIGGGASYSKGYHHYHRPPVRRYCYPGPYHWGYSAWGCAPAFSAWPLWCGPAFVVSSGSFYRSSIGFGYTSVDYWPSGGGISTYTNQPASPSSDYYAWQDSVRASESAGVNDLIAAVGGPSSPSTIAGIPERSFTPPPDADPLEAGWLAFAAGDARTAMGFFATEAEADPDRVQPKVGYALSAAALGEIRAAAWSMRRAWGTGPDSIGYFPVGNGMIERLDALSAELRWQASRGALEPGDLWFLIAAVDYLRFKPEESKQAADFALRLGQDHPAMRALVTRVEADLLGR